MNKICEEEHLLIRGYCIKRFNLIPKDSIKYLIEYHKNHKYLFMTFSPLKLKSLGRIVANKNKDPINLIYSQYNNELLDLLKNPPTQSNRKNSIYHIFGYFKNYLSLDEEQSFFDDLDKYSRGLKDYNQLVLKLNEFTIKYNQSYLKNQYIFKPYKL